MEAPFRFTVQNVKDVERLLSALQRLPDLVPGSLSLTEGLDLLGEQFAAEGRGRPPRSILALFRALWKKPLQAQHPRFLRLQARVLAPPPAVISLRVNVPTVDALPRWVDAEGSCDPKEQARLLDIYRALSRASGLPLIAV